MSATHLVTALAYAALGLAAGLAYFAILRVNVRLYLAVGARLWPFALHGLRLAAVATLFWAIATQGALPLFSGLAGFLVARVFALRSKGGTE